MVDLVVMGVVAFGVFLILAAVAGVVWYLVFSLKTRNAAQTLAQQLGWKPLIPGRAGRDTWYGGVAQGRRVAIKMVALQNQGATDSPRHGLYLRIVMDVIVREPLRASALRSIRDSSSLHRFEEAFSTENPGRFGIAAREAMVGFVTKGYPTGLQGVTYRSAPGTRNLWLKDRATIPPEIFDPRLYSDARTVLIHDHPHPGINQEAFGKLLYELALVAYAVEQGR